MRNFLDAKLMAKTLRESLKQREIELSHSECLELVAQQFGVANWNILSASINAEENGGIDLKVPEGWHIWWNTDQRFHRLGLHPELPEMILIESRFSRQSGADLGATRYGNLGQFIAADDFKGKHAKFSAKLKTTDADRAGIWISVMDDGGHQIRRDLMTDDHPQGPLTGTRDWTEVYVVLDVPKKAAQVTFGIYLENHGQVLAQDANLETVSTKVPITNRNRTRKKPLNLSFWAK